MRPAARLQSAIELLDAIIVAARDNGPAADVIAKQFFAQRRYAGSKDRRAIRDLTWQAIRHFGDCPDNGRTAFATMADQDAELSALFDGSDYGPAVLSSDVARSHSGPIPQWLNDKLPAFLDAKERGALLDRAPLDIRVNTAISSVENVAELIPQALRLDGVPDALRLPTGYPLEQHALYQNGTVEIQDAGSQHIAQVCEANPGMCVIDLCAGAGGKTLALASSMAGSGRLIAADTNRARLAQLTPRAQRAGVASMIETLLLNGGKEAEALQNLAGSADIVLVDAPCSGSGTWRRNPETRWRLTPDRLSRVIQEQARILDFAAPLLRPNGVLVYAVCSLLEEEGANQITQFLARNSHWRTDVITTTMGRSFGEGRILTPNFDGCDGFFIARLIKL